MFRLTIGVVWQDYPSLDSAMQDCMELFPSADFSLWNDSQTEVWQDVFESHENKTVIGKIVEFPEVV